MKTKQEMTEQELRELLVYCEKNRIYFNDLDDVQIEFEKWKKIKQDDEVL